MKHSILLFILLVTIATLAQSTYSSPTKKHHHHHHSSKSTTTSTKRVTQEHPHVGRAKTVRGVNLGGWFILELWMMPSFFTDDLVAKKVTDQWSYMKAVDTATAQKALTNHWKTWVTESDFQQIKAAGLSE
jgi:aryl-phospho-beta-D-glucosidase BglC (GH1 family)